MSRTASRISKSQIKRISFGVLIRIIRRVSKLRAIQIFCLQRSGRPLYDSCGDSARSAYNMACSIIPTMSVLAFPPKFMPPSDLEMEMQNWEKFNAEFPLSEQRALDAFKRLQEIH